jgi:hypothetical protein
MLRLEDAVGVILTAGPLGTIPPLAFKHSVEAGKGPAWPTQSTEGIYGLDCTSIPGRPLL